METESNLFDNMFLRLYEVECPEIVCQNAHGNPDHQAHSFVNQHYQCYLKPSSQFITENNTKDKALRNMELPVSEIQKLVDQERVDGFNGVLIYTDGGYNDAEKEANGGILAIDEGNMVYTAGFNLDKLRIENSTRAEVATIVEAINMFKGRLVKIFTDSQNAINELERLNEGILNWNKIGNVDLWCQIADKTQEVAIVKVK